MKRVVVGTSGHIDHGKTSLVEALTGIDCDRWQEEKDRGITIDLGFAHLETETPEGEALQLSFVDVPGHERFLNNALAGLGGIRLMMLVVAADEGVKPQTEEHLSICSLLDIPAGLVALTKSDLVDDEVLELARLELEESLAGTPFEGVPIVEVSSKTGAGVDELKARLIELASVAELHATRRQLPTRLPIDRAFHLKGLGVIVTGTLMTGEISPGASLDLMPPRGRNKPVSVRVRSVQVHGEERQSALAGERTSLQLSGADLEQLRRGHQLVEAGSVRASRSLLARLNLLTEAPISVEGSKAIRFHLTSSEVVGRMRALAPEAIAPGESGLVEIRLDIPVVSVRGDRFIVRRPSPQTTLGGGRILDPSWLRRRGASLERALAGLADREDGESEQQATTRALLYWVSSGGEAGMELLPLAQKLGEREVTVRERLETLVEDQKLLHVPSGAGHGERWLEPAAYLAVSERARAALNQHYKENRLSHGLPKAEAARRITRGRATLLSETYLGWLAKQGILQIQGDLVVKPGRGSALSDDESSLSKAIIAEFEKGGLTPPSPAETRDRLEAQRQIFEGVLGYLIKDGQLVRIGGDLIVSRAALDEMRAQVLASDWQEFGVAEFKDHYGLSRKWAIPLLEYLDQQRITQRVGNLRRVLRPKAR